MTDSRMDMENAVDNCASEFSRGGAISKIQAQYTKEAKAKVSSTTFWNYVQSLNIPGFRDAVEKALNLLD